MPFNSTPPLAQLATLAALSGMLLLGQDAHGAAAVPAGSRPTLNLDGVWAFATDPERAGEKEQWFQPGATWPAMPRPGYAPGANGAIRVPGIWDQQGYGVETPKVRHNFVGAGWYRRTVAVPAAWAGRRIFLGIGGVHRYAKVWVNGQCLGEHIGYLSEFEFDVTEAVKPGQSAVVVIRVDSQQRWDVDTMFGASDLADYMDVAWGGIWGHVRLEARADAWLGGLFLQSDVHASNCTASARVWGRPGQARAVRLEVLDRHGALVGQAEHPIDSPPAAAGSVQVTAPVAGAELWSPDQPVLYRARLTLLGDGQPLDRVECRFGLREIRLVGPHILLNGRRLFLRGYGDDHIYPEQMAMPCDPELHRQRLRLIKSYGFNHVRHHSTIMPPEYYDACDEIGILPTAEFPIAYDSFLPGGEHWKRHVRPGTDPGPAWETYKREWAAAIRRHRNHPSILAWVMGNELWNGIALRHEFKRLARELDPSRPFADTDGVTEMWQHILNPQNDRDTLDLYFLMFDVFRHPFDLPGKFNTPRPLKPVISHESGNYVTFSRPEGVDAFRHNIKPFWMTEGRAKLERLRLLGEAPQWAEKSERLYLLLHKTNLETLRQNPFISGYHWWLFQDYWTTANGLVDHYFRPKAIRPDEVLRFNRDVVLLQEGIPLTCRGGSNLHVTLRVSNFSPQSLPNAQCSWQWAADESTFANTPPPFVRTGQTALGAGQGELTDAAQLDVRLPDVSAPTRLRLHAQLRADAASALTQRPPLSQNDWSTWIFPSTNPPSNLDVPRYASPAPLKQWPALGLAPIPKDPDLPSCAVYVAGRLDRRVLAAVERGACLVLLQGGRAFASRPVTFRSSWWKAGDDLNANVCGTLVYDHPITRPMAPEGWCDAGWFHLVEGARKISLEDLPGRPRVIVRALPSLRAVQDEALLFEVGLGRGALLVSGFNHQKAQGRPENDYLLGRMLAHAATLPRPQARWPLSALPVSEELPLGSALSGFQKLVRNEGEEGVWYTYREDNVTQPICRQTQPGHLVQWDTAPVPSEIRDERITFMFGGGLGYRSEPRTEGFMFQVNGIDQVRFDLPEQTNRWRSADGRIELRFVALRHLPHDELGVFQVSLPRSLATPGTACRFGVRSLGQGSRRWFGLNRYTDAHLEE
ncbi:MAG: hypothetical protein JXQ71_00180 [Verrucomicrobia bacterium]|nr:hypothetical protein [Verrucomicrobiota bacterium]